MGAARVARPSVSRAIADGLSAGHVLLVAGAGYGKTAALEEALELRGTGAVWVACGECAGPLTNRSEGPGRLRMSRKVAIAAMLAAGSMAMWAAGAAADDKIVIHNWDGTAKSP